MPHSLDTENHQLHVCQLSYLWIFILLREKEFEIDRLNAAKVGLAPSFEACSTGHCDVTVTAATHCKLPHHLESKLQPSYSIRRLKNEM
jgi:hypothetical protein